MPSCLPPRYRFLDLLLALGGTVTFLVDLSFDIWGAVNYYRAGDMAWAALLLFFYGLSSAALQLLSWGWFQVDLRDEIQIKDIPSDFTPSHATGCSGVTGKYDNEGGLGQCSAGLLGEDAHKSVGYRDPQMTAGACGNGHIDYDQEGTMGEMLGEAETDHPGDEIPIHNPGYPVPPPRRHASRIPAERGDALWSPDCPDAVPWTASKREADAEHSAHGMSNPTCILASHTVFPEDKSVREGTGDRVPKESNLLLGHFYTSRPLFCPWLLAILHFFQLGYPLRCIHSLEVGVTAYRSKGGSSVSKQYQEYAYLLTHDISMMRLIETFLENTPQLILLLYILLQRGMIQTFQYFSICISFISISWAILDYHQSLRFFLKDKQKLGVYSSVVYFLWNFLLIFSRILCITLFTSVFQCWIGLHFFLLWVPFFIWVRLQKTNFMEDKILEHFYRTIVATILYFSWFNIADGRTICRCIVYYLFLTVDSLILLVSWKWWRFPSVLDAYELHIFLAVCLALLIGFLLRIIYYKFLHPNVWNQTTESYDEPDGRSNGDTGNRNLVLRSEPRMLQIWRQQY
ncbi:XK-related protein 8 [Pelodytes ibericus]